MSDEQILFDRKGLMGRITLNRPKALNALTLDMIKAMASKLDAWAGDDDVGFIVLRGSPRPDGRPAFCAGGDVRALYDARIDPDSSLTRDFFAEEYRLNREIFRCPKPYVSLIDGVSMGGGVGVSVHGRFRVVTENTVFAMPETSIGMFPDVGGTYFLPRLPGAIGMYLALTGARLKAADCLYTGVATHYVPSDKLDELESALADIDAQVVGSDVDAEVARLLHRYSEDPGDAPLAHHRQTIDDCFSADSVPAVLEALAGAGEWAAKVREDLLAKSPTSMMIAFRQVREGKDLDFEEAMTLEYRVSQRIMAGHDFREGVRALLVDRDNSPAWKPARLEDIAATDIDAYFAPLPDGDLSFD